MRTQTSAQQRVDNDIHDNCTIIAFTCLGKRIKRFILNIETGSGLCTSMLGGGLGMTMAEGALGLCLGLGILLFPEEFFGNFTELLSRGALKSFFGLFTEIFPFSSESDCWFLLKHVPFKYDCSGI